MLDPDTATEAGVREAYARMVKQHPPDGDAEEFREVREAYELALGMMRERDAGGGEAPDEMREEAHEGGEAKHAAAATRVEEASFAAFPDAVGHALGELESAAASGNAEQLEAALQCFDEECETARVDGAARASALEQACAEDIKLLSAAISDRLLLRLVEMGQVNLPHLVLSTWAEEERRDRIAQFGCAIVDEAGALGTPDGGVMMARVGVMVGLEDPALASSLGSLAAAHLPEEVRADVVGKLEHEAALGAAFEDVAPEMKPFWLERLRRVSEPHDWQDEQSLQALDALIDHNRYTWQGWGIVKQLLPSEHWEQVEDRLRNQAQQIPQTASAPQASKSYGWLMIPAVVIVLIALRYVGSDDPVSQVPIPGMPPAPASDGTVAGSEDDVDRRHERWDSLQNSSTGTVRKSSTASIPTPRAPDPAAPAPPPAPLSSPAPVAAAAPPPDAEPPAPASTLDEKKKENEAYLRALRNGTLFDGSFRPRPSR